MNKIAQHFRILKLTLSLLLSHSTLVSYAQNRTEAKIPYQVFDKMIGVENTSLSNGVEYLEQHIVRNDQHKYFLSSKFLEGNVLYDDQQYFGVLMKYNVFDDVLLVLLPNSDGTSSLQLHNQKLTSFSIKGHSFINILNNETAGFHEVLLNLSETLLLKKHNKKIHKHLDRSFTYYEFENDDSEYLIFFKDSYSPLNSKRDVLEVFPDRERQIKKFYRNNVALRKEHPDLFLSELLQHLNQES